MKVNDYQVVAGLESLKKLKPLMKPGTVKPNAGITQESDNIEISLRARDVRSAAKTLASLSSVRQDKVDELKGKIKAGMYDAGGDAIASSMIKSAFMEGLV